MATEEVPGFNKATDFDAAQARRQARFEALGGKQREELSAKDLLWGIALHLGLVDSRTGYWTPVMHTRIHQPKQQTRTATEMRALAAKGSRATESDADDDDDAKGRRAVRGAVRGSQGQAEASGEVPELPKRG